MATEKDLGEGCRPKTFVKSITSENLSGIGGERVKMYSNRRKILLLAAVSDSELNFPSQRMLSEKTIASVVILVPRGRPPFGQHQEPTALLGADQKERGLWGRE